MTVNDVALFFCLLLLGGAAGLLVASTRPSLRTSIVDSSLLLIAIVAVGATLGSLYFSEVAGYIPCELCWYQRIGMYPLAIVGPLGAVRHDRASLHYTLAISIVGLAIALYHVQLQLFPEQSSFCDVTSPCTVSPVKAMGWMTIPHMSAISFGLIAALAALSIRSHVKEIQ